MPNPPGRPPLDPRYPSVVVSLAIPSNRFDALCRRAALERLSVPEIIRRDLLNSASKKTQTSRLQPRA
jgi:hypothetical protein